MNSYLKICAVVAAMALLVPGGAAAKRPEGKPDKGNKHGKLGKQDKAKTPKLKLVTANVKGVVTANDGTTMTVTVDKASGHAKACKGMSLTFDVSESRFHTADNDADGDMDAIDVRVGDEVKVRTQLALLKGRKTTCAAAEELAIAAKAVHNRTTPPVEDEVEEEETLEEEESLGDEETLDEEETVDGEDEVLDEEETVDEEDAADVV